MVTTSTRTFVNDINNIGSDDFDKAMIFMRKADEYFREIESIDAILKIPYSNYKVYEERGEIIEKTTKSKLILRISFEKIQSNYRGNWK